MDTSGLEESVNRFLKLERSCPANKQFLGDTLCPKCGASSSEACRETASAAYSVVQSARAMLASRTIEKDNM